jgi:hypothetical protein
MQTNRALRASAIIIFGWIGLRSSFLLMSSGAEISASPTPQLAAVLPINQTNFKDGAIAKPEIIGPTIQHAQTISDVRPLAAETKMVTAQQIDPFQEDALIVQPAPVDPARQAAPQTLPRSQEAKAEYSHVVSSKLFDLRVSAWAIVRPMSSDLNLTTNGQLGGSQAGFRIQQPLLRRQRTALNLRISTPLDQRLGREAGIGLSTRSIEPVPIELIVERRVALDRGGRNAFAAIMAGGFDNERLIKKISISGYLQTGIVGFSRKDGFIDGALRVEQALLDRDRTGLLIGGGLWGAAQPNVERIDVGPIVAISQKLGSANIRISADYRWRIAGQARPGSGPVLSIGTDF